MSKNNSNESGPRNQYWQPFQQLQQAALEQWGAALASAQAAATQQASAAAAPSSGLPPFKQALGHNPFELFSQAAQDMAARNPPSSFSVPPEALQQLQQEYLEQIGHLMQRESKDLGDVLRQDKRFASDNWLQSSFAAATAALYKINAAALQKMVEITETDAKNRARLQFAIDQWLAACAPNNFMALNPDVLSKAVASKGESIAKGMQNMWQDLQRGHISMTDEGQFEVGKNLAMTPGSVVFENAFFQLIEYRPVTAKVYERPLLLVPPCINKYYILDLQPGNSFVEYSVAQGLHTFVVSWRNPDASMDTTTWDDYIEHGVMRAIQAVQDISGQPSINTLGFCVGGTMLATALAVLAARGQHPAASATLLTTFVDFSDTGILDVFIDENSVQFREMQMGQKGLMKGQDLASTFSFLRPNELVWNYVVGNYLKGETPPPFDLLYWNSDGTNLPGPFYAWYLRNTYLENNLVKPGETLVCGERIDFGLVQTPLYIYGSREDHIVPIRGAYASTQVFPGNKRFVMGASGHIAGVINPPAKGKRHYWTSSQSDFPEQWNDWLEHAEQQAGSWWPDWAHWIAGHAGKQRAAPQSQGNAGLYKVLEAAPGSYVKQRA